MVPFGTHMAPLGANMDPVGTPIFDSVGDISACSSSAVTA